MAFLFELLPVVLVVAVVIGLVIAAMAVGVIFSNREIKGSCGGLATMTDGDGNSICMACGESPDDCEREAPPECAEGHDTPKQCDQHDCEQKDCEVRKMLAKEESVAS
ncbi:(Na+)-NQR maturation NqrM [Calycomorphotria hydatis]|uniref:ApbE family protein n=1 Tax=Calycomorphotria hydatis TaxID=2528027 RepID=A0A517TEN7_9PLAN|nr:(Na+)-NQR maturation NqrM [Calycomorphotria hydatis]QDT66837.1 hypothetical protein V22_41090 [Calycomorphotria hydatis]